MNHIGAAGNGHPPPLGHAPYYSPGTAQTPQSSVPTVPVDIIAVANLASVVTKMLTGIASHAQCSVAAVAEVLLTGHYKGMKDVFSVFCHTFGANYHNG